MTYPVYDFTDPLLNYSLVEATANQMLSQILATSDCCSSKKRLNAVLCDVSIVMQCIEIDRSDTLRYKADVEASYKLLYPLT